jgi:hypothetical protein
MSDKNQPEVRSTKNVAINIVGNFAVMIARILDGKHKEFGANQLCGADAFMALYLGFLFVSQVSARAQKTGSGEQVPSVV